MLQPSHIDFARRTMPKGIKIQNLWNCVLANQKLRIENNNSKAGVSWSNIGGFEKSE
jgi:hypothetical protein